MPGVLGLFMIVLIIKMQAYLILSTLQTEGTNNVRDNLVSKSHRVLSLLGVFLQKGQLLKVRSAEAAREGSQVFGLVQMVKVIMESLEKALMSSSKRKMGPLI